MSGSRRDQQQTGWRRQRPIRLVSDLHEPQDVANTNPASATSSGWFLNQPCSLHGAMLGATLRIKIKAPRSVPRSIRRILMEGDTPRDPNILGWPLVV